MQMHPQYRVVRRSERVPPSNQAQMDSAFDYCLACWTELMHGDPDKDLGVKTMRLPAGESDGFDGDSGEQQQANDARYAVATGTCIGDMAADLRDTIWVLYGVCKRSSRPVLDIALLGPIAKIDLEKKLRKNSCTSVLF